MPHSARENNADIEEWVAEHGIQTVLDVGAGSGTYYHLLNHLVTSMDAVEVWAPYVEEFGLRYLYRSVFTEDVRTIGPNPTWEWDRYDLIIFGDVLEHMTKNEAAAVWKWAHHVARYGIISVPKVHWPQDAENGNPHEAHDVEHLLPEDIRRWFGPFVLDKDYHFTSTFIKAFQ
jgi:2-polyprenyl-3-methyl-5-hydroxy-6-metoxy-1,4-benzoquinol methylase